MAGATWTCCHLGAFCVHHATMHHVTSCESHIRKVYACLAVTCHLRFWQNDRGLLRATAVTRGWNGYRNKSQHRKLTLEKKILPRPFDHESGALTTELSPLPDLSPPSRSTKDIKPISWRKMLENFLEKMSKEWTVSRKWQDRKSKKTRQKRWDRR